MDSAFVNIIISLLASVELPVFCLAVAFRLSVLLRSDDVIGVILTVPLALTRAVISTIATFLYFETIGRSAFDIRSAILAIVLSQFCDDSISIRVRDRCSCSEGLKKIRAQKSAK